MHTDHFPEFADKMRTAELSESAIGAFRFNYQNLLAGGTGMIAETDIEPVTTLPRLEEIRRDQLQPQGLLAQVAIVKLNGGLGTSMGLAGAKSLLPVREGLTFLDFIARQVLWLRSRYNTPLRFLLMNSFTTSRDTRKFLEQYPDLGAPEDLELLQSQVPKVDAQTLRPAAWPQNPHLEWCPPGHGDIYPSLVSSGMLRRLRDDGVQVLFVSNSDNLGATLDLDILRYFLDSAKPFLMEVAERTLSDRKGGHLARRNGQFLLRESAQCPDADAAAFQDISRHRFFNTNNLWINVERLEQALQNSGGFLPLPMIKNTKTIDPRDKHSPAVIQLETAMGAAIELFADAGALVVPRTRFAPVKTTSDLLALRSDAYSVTEDWRLVLSASDSAAPPLIDLDQNHYRLVDELDAKLTGGVPSLKACARLNIRGPVLLTREQRFAGKVTVTNAASEPRLLPPGEYRDQTVTL